MKKPNGSTRRVCALSLVISLLCASPILSEVLDKGPYLQNLTSDGVTICWVTVAETSEGERYAYHEAPVSGLKPATEYRYYAGERGELTGGFRTAPVGREPFRFVAHGDTRTNHAAHQSVVNAILRANPRFVTSTGDLVDDGRVTDDWNQFFRITHSLMLRVPYWPVLGNHEENSPHYYDHFALPGVERYYSFDYGTCHFVMLDSNNLSLVNQEEQEVPRKVLQEYLEARTNYWEKQIKWLESDLELHKDADFVFVNFHHPLYSSPEDDDRREEQRELRKRFEPLLKRYRVTAVFCGHDHFYERNEVDGIHYIVTGGGGAPLDEFGEPLPSSVKRESVHHFVMVDINDETASFTALTRDGRVIDAFESRTRH